jgi:hypothetical protein
MTRRHRPAYVLYVAGRPPISCCDCHYGQPLKFDRPLPKTTPTTARAAA